MTFWGEIGIVIISVATVVQWATCSTCEASCSEDVLYWNTSVQDSVVELNQELPINISAIEIPKVTFEIPKVQFPKCLALRLRVSRPMWHVAVCFAPCGGMLLCVVTIGIRRVSNRLPPCCPCLRDHSALAVLCV
eukprot:1899077-Amphidinium_carterae.2